MGVAPQSVEPPPDTVPQLSFAVSDASAERYSAAVAVSDSARSVTRLEQESL